MNTHEDNLRDLVLTYLEEVSAPKAVEEGFRKEVDSKEVQDWLKSKTDTAIKGIEYV